MKSLFPVIGLLIIIASTAFAEAVEEETVTVAVSPQDILEIGNINGDISISEWDSTELEVFYRITCNNQEALDMITVEYDTDQGAEFNVEYGDDWEDSYEASVDYSVKIPASVELQIEISSVNGDIVVEGGEGNALLELVNGDISADGFAGEAEIYLVNGVITVSGSPGVNIAEVVNGEMVFAINSMEDDLILDSVSGNIELRLSTDAVVSIETLSGEVDIADSFNATVEEGYVGRTSYFGDGDFDIEISTISGSITVLD